MNTFPIRAAVIIGFAVPFLLFANDLNTGGQTGVVRTLTATTIGKAGLSVGGGFKYATDAEYAKGPNGSGGVIHMTGQTAAVVTGADPAELLSAEVFAVYGISGICDISVDLPLYEDITGWGPKSTGIGDLGVAVKLRYPYELPNAFLSQAYYCKFIFPTGGNHKGFFPRHAYYIKNDTQNTGVNAFSVEEVFINPMLAWTFDFSRLSRGVPVLLHANFGGALADLTYGTTVIAALALEVKPTRSFTLFTELTGESRIKYYSGIHNVFSTGALAADPLRLSPGFRLNLPQGFFCVIAGDIGLSSDRFRAQWNRDGYRYSTRAVPRWGGQVILGWSGRSRALDTDGDSIPDSSDRCANVPEDKDGFEDADGCPDYDNDKDGIPDSVDRCKNISEDKDGFEDADGCPDYDNDRDGIVDSLDRCPNIPEDKDGYQDNDGCPDYDNDKDGIPDSCDKCHGLPEDIDGFEDADGCPDYDNDADGVPDSVDKCMSVAGPADNSGCPRPKTSEMKRGPLILDGVMFETGKAILTPSSSATLDQVAQSLLEWGNVKLEIQGHTDSRGNDSANLLLSQQRAEAVRDYLIQKSITSDRLRAIGYGSQQPLGNNNSAFGRQKNRRVELRRID